MNISTKGLIEIMSHEGVCLSPYLDSVGVWTIGVGITKHDGVVPQALGTITIDRALAMFKDRIKAYVAPVQKLGLNLTQAQFDALVSFCYNVGEGNLRSLCRNRSLAQIGEAFSLYHKPPEVAARRNQEQRLFKAGVYSSDGKVLVFPVNAAHKPVYHKGYTLDVAKYFTHTGTTQAATPNAVPVPVPQAPTAPKAGWLIALIQIILGLFKRKAPL